MTKVFIAGSAGTTGLQIRQRLAARADLEVLVLSETRRKDPAARKQALNSCDIAFLCLPDDAVRQAVSMVENPALCVFDTSTAHRTAHGWVYGFPQLAPGQPAAIATANRIAVPGCHASGLIALVRPLVKAGLLLKDSRLSCFSLTGYSGGGKKMIAQYEAQGQDTPLCAPRAYALGQTHKHLPEMQLFAGLDSAPVFAPIVGNFYSGMQVMIPLTKQDLAPGAGMEELRSVYRTWYTGPIVRYCEAPQQDGFLSADALSGRDDMQVTVQGGEERLLLVAQYDNLGKGASGAAVECMNLRLGLPATTGLKL